jgi:hypothetical protein
MPLIRIPAPFDHPDWLFEVKLDGFRALAHIEGHLCRSMSRHGHELQKFTLLAEEIAHSVRAHNATLTEKLSASHQTDDHALRSAVFGGNWPFFCAFDDRPRFNASIIT